MKRFIIGICILTVLFLSGLGLSYAMGKMYAPISRLLEDASQYALEENLENGIRQAEKAKSLWDRQKRATATVADHTPMEEIDHLFQEMAVYAKAGEAPHFAACCAQLAAMVRDMGQAHRMDLWNLL